MRIFDFALDPATLLCPVYVGTGGEDDELLILTMGTYDKDKGYYLNTTTEERVILEAKEVRALFESPTVLLWLEKQEQS